jgi:hypothetical protein
MQIEMRTEIRAERHRARIGQETVTFPVMIEVMTEARSAACMVVSTAHIQRWQMEVKTYHNADEVQFF